MSEYIRVYDTKLKTERDITKKMQGMMPKRFQILGEAPEPQKKSLKEDAEPAADERKPKKPKIIHKDEE